MPTIRLSISIIIIIIIMVVVEDVFMVVVVVAVVDVVMVERSFYAELFDWEKLNSAFIEKIF